MSKTAIVYTVDDNKDVWHQLVLSLRSIRAFEPERFDGYVLVNVKKSWMTTPYGEILLDVSSLVDEYHLNDTGASWKGRAVPPMLLFRLLIPLVPQLSIYDKILYLDADTEVWTEKFFSILDKDLHGEILAIKDSLSQFGIKSRISALQKSNSIDSALYPSNWMDFLEGSKTYVNSGVLVINNKALRPGYEERASYVLGKIKELKPFFPDQDIINLYYRVSPDDDRRYNSWYIDDHNVLLRHYVRSLRRRTIQYPLISRNRPNDRLDGVKNNDDLGAFSGIVDRIYVLTKSTSNGNVDRVQTWLRSAGVKDVTVIDTNYTGKYDRLLELTSSTIIDKTHLDNWMGHYKAVMDGLSHGSSKIAVFESTYAPNGLEKCLDSLSKDFDFAILTGQGAFIRASEARVISSRGYIVNTRCMIELRRLFESLWDKNTRGRCARYVHHWMSGDPFKGFRAYIRLGG